MKDITTIEGWRDFQEAIKGNSHPLFAVLRGHSSRCTSFDGQTVTVALKYPYHRELLVRDSMIENSTFTKLKNAMSNYLGKKVGLEVRCNPSAEYISEAERLAAEKERQEEEQRHLEMQRKQQAERKARLRRQLMLASRIPQSAFQSRRLEDFVVMPGMEEAYKAVLNYLPLNDDLTELDAEQYEGWEREPPHFFLTLCGGTGRGKTHLALAVGIQLLKWDQDVVYWQVEELLDAFRDAFRGDEGNRFNETMVSVKECGFLILDDLGAEKGTEWAYAKLDELIDYRYINEFATVFTTNLRSSQLQPRIASRIQEGQIIILTGEDFRLLKAKKRADTPKISYNKHLSGILTEGGK